MADAQLPLARRLRALGFSVFAVPRPDPSREYDGKTPATPWREWSRRPPTDDELVRLFAGPPMNLAVATGAVSNYVVVDLDTSGALCWGTRRLPYTPWQTKTPRGYHLGYRHPGIRVPNRARIETRAGRLAIDVRGDGGYVIAAGSLHATGVEYVEGGDWSAPREDVPAFSPDWLARPTRSMSAPSRSMPRPVGDVVERARKYLAAVPRPEIGQGSDVATLYVACRLVRGFALHPADAETLLWEWVGGRPGWTRAWVAQKVTHAVRYGTESLGALR